MKIFLEDIIVSYDYIETKWHVDNIELNYEEPVETEETLEEEVVAEEIDATEETAEEEVVDEETDIGEHDLKM